ncbi:TATA element modulatory factor 1 TATA binding protein [Artemisia annua]|uniref:TATA element modulatory factor 1 TATA binding protein n=1 Tax=Artemisia annua TaxID=35608 RepID=A0A2U1KNR5_ARTAN|nr:TATA element modulatory factor 1 TATA binding protein [Artemisia annua]
MIFVGLQASERQCEELVTQVPESTRPLLRQIEAIQIHRKQRQKLQELRKESVLLMNDYHKHYPA